MRLKYLLILFPFLLTGCIKEQEKVSWLKIEKWDLVANPNAQNDPGVLTHNFNQVFVNMDGQMIGAFELPAKIPIIGEGLHNFILIPGVVNNGINATKARYPFMTHYNVDFELKIEDTVTMHPETMYGQNVQFLVEDFETPGMQIINDGGPADIERVSDQEFLEWGNFLGKVVLNNQDSLWLARTDFGVSFPKQGSNVYLELDYINTNAIVTSVISANQNTIHEDVHIQINPRTDMKWRKIYIDLKEIVSFRGNATVNEVGFSAVFDKITDENVIYIDNVKVIFQ